MTWHIFLYAALGYLCVKVPVTVFAYLPWLRDRDHRAPLLLGTIGLLFGAVILVALTS